MLTVLRKMVSADKSGFALTNPSGRQVELQDDGEWRHPPTYRERRCARARLITFRSHGDESGARGTYTFVCTYKDLMDGAIHG